MVLKKSKDKEDLTVDTISNPSLTIMQSKQGYRFSLDPIILADFFIKSKFKAHNIVDLGTGTGIIPLLISSKTKKTKIVGIEIQETLYNLAKENVKLNSMEKRIDIIKGDIKKIGKILPAEKFDAVMSNPPFREPKSGRLSNNAEKTIARHEILCTLKDILKASFFLLKAGGALFMIFHPRRLGELFSELRKSRFEPKIVRFVHSNKDSDAVMVLIKAKKGGNPGLKVLKPLYVYEKEKTYSEEMKKIYGIESI
ncbi:MAG: tRNA1(Val) (adenine(37)-N6)-methyltransferase [Candidatus Schekmanbacteria bacterium]|nr:MAG: tRNA1(Val) (adenine(37)-N6)-methyltransferase [Candidatus Schekmanbacteria bacterium]